MTLDEATSKLEAIARHPCHCNVCKHSASLARSALMQIAPSGKQLLTMDPKAERFKAFEEQFREDELRRLLGALATIALGDGECAMKTIVPEPPKIPDLPYAEGMNVALERYRKYSARRRIEMKPKPRIPGTYVIK